MIADLVLMRHKVGRWMECDPLAQTSLYLETNTCRGFFNFSTRDSSTTEQN